MKIILNINDLSHASHTHMRYYIYLLIYFPVVMAQHYAKMIMRHFFWFSFSQGILWKTKRWVQTFTWGEKFVETN